MELRYVKGLSDKRIADLNSMRVFTAEDLVRQFPRNYLDMRKAVNLFEVQNNEFALIKATVIAVPAYVPQKGRYTFFKISCIQDGEPFNIIWFNQPYIKSKLKEGETYLFYGRIRNRNGIISMTNPSFEPFDENLSLKGIVPVYSVKGNLTQKVMRSVVKDALNKVNLTSVISHKNCNTYSLSDLKSAYFAVHEPSSYEELHSACERIAVEEYYIMISAFKFIKGDRQEARINRYNLSASDILKFSERFPYELTKGQKDAVNDIYKDLKSPTVMNRLLQGDVGSGKTAVSLCAIYAALKSGYQVAFLAPTEILAKQNLAIIQKFLPEYPAGFLSGSLTPKEKTSIKQKIASGEYRVVVGTHAILEENVKFKSLSLSVCDEQQRFGVAQRNNLVQKGVKSDVLIMSATPIPRTLSLIFYGDLDISTIPDKPAKRAEIKTYVVPRVKYEPMLKFIDGEFEKGRRAYFVCPKIEGDDEGSVISVTELYDELKEKLPTRKFSLLHGKMKDDKKSEIMLDFKNGKIDAVVSTTVIEVGIDVPEATVMCIFGADRFGLSQLHQLRGRVGRSDLESFCFLIADNPSDSAITRLNALKNNSDGFKISEIDYDERGGGDFLGTRQSGKMMTDLGALRYTTAAIFLAKKLSDDAFLSGEDLKTLKEIAMPKYAKLKDVTLN